jgi:hypothetical protein
MRIITTVTANDDWTLDISFANGKRRRFDVKPLLASEAFSPLADINLFKSIRNRGYFIEWENEADLSADTLYLEGTPLS